MFRGRDIENSGGASAVSEAQPSSTIYENVVEFVENYLGPVYRRHVSDLSDAQWCPEWWKHAEATIRLDALWRAWEYYRLDGGAGISVWLNDHADRHMRRLLDQRGPFTYCNVGDGHQDMLDPMPLKSPPPHLFPDPIRSDSETATDSGRVTVYRDVVEYVENYLSLVYRRQVSGYVVWCPEWWKHAEAIARLDALWRAWEYYRLDGRAGISVWFLEHADPHMFELLDRRGPFEYCGELGGHQNTLAPLPLRSPPPNIFRDPIVADLETESDSA